MKTPRISVTLPKDKKKDVQIISKRKGYDNFSAYVRNLITKDVSHTKQQNPEWFAM